MEFMPDIAYSYVRFSTPQQLKGDSLRRQFEATQRYVTEHGLVLDETLNLRDLGISAFRGKNVEQGALGAFIKAIETGRVRKGSYLIVESLDRISRNEVIEALEIFLRIIRAGINIVTLADDHVYSKASLRSGINDLIISITVMSRAHEESKIKSYRRAERWARAKKEARDVGNKITRKIPFWLSLPDRKGEFIVKESEALIVKRIFELATKGFGYLKISQYLNQQNVPPPGSSKSWGTSTIGTILRKKTVLGHLEMKDGVIEGYYPSILSEDQWKSAQSTPVAKGHSSVQKANVFTGLLYCGECGGRMQVDSSKNSDGERTSRIICQNARRGKGCQITVWKMDEFEYSFLQFVQEIDVASLIGELNSDVILCENIDELTKQIEDYELKLNALLDALEAGAANALVKRIQEYESELIKLKKERGCKVVELQQSRSADEKLKTAIAAVRRYYIRLSVSVTEEEYVELRYSLAAAIASVVKQIDVYPRPWMIEGEEIEARRFLVMFRNGAARYVVPEDGINHHLPPPGALKVPQSSVAS